MKKTVLTTSILLFTFCALSQTDEYNLKKYWKFRDQFVEDFVKIGPTKGEGIPAGARKPCFCIDNDGDSEYGEPFGEMHWGDGMIKQGHYIGFLATDYALRKKNNLDVTGVLNELYYALFAINRVDYYAESTLDEVYTTAFDPKLNGFYMREDVGEDFCLNWESNDEDFRCTNSTYYQNNNSAKINSPSDYLITKENSYQMLYHSIEPCTRHQSSFSR